MIKSFMKEYGTKAIILSPDKILLFHRDNKPGLRGANQWHIVGGGSEDGETPELTVRREVAEEVTYVPKIFNYWGITIDSEGRDNYVFVVLVDKSEEDLFIHGPGEGQGIGFFTIDQALQLDLTPKTRQFLEKPETRIMIETRVLPKTLLYGA